MEIKSSEFFRNMKSLPPPGTDEFEQLINWESEKILGGVNINGVHISGWLYWHLNHWWIRVDAEDKYGNATREEKLPDLRDNEWVRAEFLEACRVEKEGYMEIGGRQGGKSEMEASFFGMNAIMFKLTQNVIVCGNDNDLSLLKDKVDFGLRKVWEGLNIPRLDKTWRTNQVRLGYKTPDGDDEIWSYIVIRNAKDGHNTEVAAGTTAKSFIMDEVGKYAFAQSYEAGAPALKGKFGFRAIPILVGTGGSFTNGKDAENFFHNPRANKFHAMVDPATGKETCLFLSGLYRQETKEDKTLAHYLIQEKGMQISDDSDLYNIPMQISNKEAALKLINEEREAALKNSDKTIYLKKVMYYPLTVQECFLSNSDNIFDAETAKRQLLRINQNPPVATPVIMVHDGEKIVHQFSDKVPISNFPTKPEDNLDAPIMIYEFPVENPPYGLYVAGVDPYRQGQAKYSTSLGSVYIYKRMHSLTGEKYQDMFVASYCARPKSKSDWEKQARYLIKYYNARTLCENDDISFIEYMKAEGDAHYLEKQPEWIKELVPNTTVKRDYGVHRSVDRIRDFLHNTYKKYLEEKIYKETDENGDIVTEILGVTRILDPMLLEETIQYNDTGNFDRLIAAELALAQAAKMAPLYGEVKDSPKRKPVQKQKKSVMFAKSKGVFGKGKSKMFR